MSHKWCGRLSIQEVLRDAIRQIVGAGNSVCKRKELVQLVRTRIIERRSVSQRMIDALKSLRSQQNARLMQDAS